MDEDHCRGLQRPLSTGRSALKTYATVFARGRGTLQRSTTLLVLWKSELQRSAMVSVRRKKNISEVCNVVGPADEDHCRVGTGQLHDIIPMWPLLMNDQIMDDFFSGDPKKIGLWDFSQ